jgi:hypothetical protein
MPDTKVIRNSEKVVKNICKTNKIDILKVKTELNSMKTLINQNLHIEKDIARLKEALPELMKKIY